MWALWNDISRCPHGIWSVLSQSQLAARKDSVSHGEHQQVEYQLSTPWLRAEGGLSEALKITQHGMVKRRSYGSIWHPAFVSLCPSLFHTPTEIWHQKKNKNVIFFMIKCYGHCSIHVYLFLKLLYNIKSFLSLKLNTIIWVDRNRN